MEDLEQREQIKRYRRHLSDERRQYYNERRTLVRQQNSDLLCLLMAHERDRHAENSMALLEGDYATKVSFGEAVIACSSSSFLPVLKQAATEDDAWRCTSSHILQIIDFVKTTLCHNFCADIHHQHALCEAHHAHVYT